ncbi:hypothetical protein DZC78_03180 [Olleya aquimaris]|uniref:Uncharacterized protein n=1 Tax=Olleya sediminilitoris TaxID=2795739 RepID=A0ABS1WI72_9FLAO|nr:hypothetical protein [Olleya sediminilitoris]AXO79427.1 hypothetical protein DZC78_03180 [Olleya aquimaris]MBL7558808.1 hypothetical protein [Olleya sediminilitoris]
MKTINSQLAGQVKDVYLSKFGTFYILEDVIISEINEGEHLTIENAQELLNCIHIYYGKNKKFAYISNRVNNYSIEVLDYPKINQLLPNLELFAIISYSHFDKMNISIEKQFCKIPYKGFSTIKKAYKFANQFLEQSIIGSSKLQPIPINSNYKQK